MIWLTLPFAVASAVFYRMGGSAEYDTKFRDIGCSVLVCLLLGLVFGWHWTLIIVFGAMWGALSTYWKRGPNARWYNWALTGMGYSLAILPFVIALSISGVDNMWIGFLIRTVVLAGLTSAWSEIMGNAVWEECGRGALIILTIPLLLI